MASSVAFLVSTTLPSWFLILYPPPVLFSVRSTVIESP